MKKMIHVLLYSAFVIGVFAIALPCKAAVKPIVLTPETLDGRYIGLHTEYFEDTQNRLSIDDILTEEISRKFTPGKSPSYSLAISSSACWVRFTVQNPSTEDVQWFLEYAYQSGLEQELYIPIPHSINTFTVKKISVLIPSPKREINSINPVFSFRQKPGLCTYYMRLTSKAGLVIPLRIWSLKGLNENLVIGFGFLYLFYGIMIVMLLYNLVIYFSVRESTYLLYVLKICSFIIVYSTTDGFSQNFIYAGNEFLINHAFGTTVAFTAFVITIFTRSYLDSKKNSPIIDKIFIGFGAVAVLLMALSLVLDTGIYLNLVFPLIIAEILFILFITGPVYIRLRSRPGIYYYGAYMVYMAGNILVILCVAGILPNSIIFLRGPQIGALCMMVLFSLGLADKINTMRNDLADLNENLERKVIERTSELHAAMEELEAMNQNLQATMEELAETNEQLVRTRDALWGEMQLAKKIQTVLLPVQPAIPCFEIAAHMSPADEVGGDYYDVIDIDGRQWIVIGDVSGHGVPAGLVMMMVQTAIQTALAQNSGMKPAELLTVINKTISKNIRLLGDNKYMTITVLAYIEKGIFQFSGLHQDILVYRKKTDMVEAIPTSGMWIGLVDDIGGMLHDETLRLDGGDALLLYTDGITEARDSVNALYADDKLARLFREHGKSSPEQIKDAILKSLRDYSCSDDITLLVLKRE